MSLRTSEAKRCLLWHSWGAWDDNTRGSGSIVQVRRCKQCRQVEIKTVRVPHVHDWDVWGSPTHGTVSGWGRYGSDVYMQVRFCKTCKEMEHRMIDPVMDN